MYRTVLIGIIQLAGLASLTAQAPEWLTRRPISNQFFYGRGEGSTAEEAEASGKKEILLQLSSQVNSVIGQGRAGSGGTQKVDREVNAFFDTVRLRAADVEDRFTRDGRHHALVRYSEDHGLILVSSVIMRYRDKHKADLNTVIDQLDDGAMIWAARMERVLHDVVSTNYGADLSVSLRGNVLVIRTFNFAVYSTDLGEGQRRSLEALGIVLLDELDYLNYGSVTVAGHAHPTGITGEQDTLVNISLVRAETVADLLSQRGVSVGIVQGMGGNWLLNDGSTEAARGLNRRVEIAMEVAP